MKRYETKRIKIEKLLTFQNDRHLLRILNHQIIIENEKRKDHKLLEKEKEEMFVDL